MRRLLVPLCAFALLMTACGGSSGLDPVMDTGAAAVQANADQTDTASSDFGAATTNDPDAVTPESAGDLPLNSIRIGDQIWHRTLPMTTGQCFVVDEGESGTDLPASSSVWGTLDGDDEIKFSANMSQSGELSALVDDQSTFHWLAGARATNLSEVEITHDFENDIISGTGIFWNAFTSERAYGSFAFQCEPTS